MYPDDGTDPNCLSDKVTPVYDYPTIWGTTLEPYYKPYNELKYYLDMTKELKRSQFILKCFGWIKDISETEAPNN